MTTIFIRKARIEDAPAIREHQMRILEEGQEFFPYALDEYAESRLSEILESDNSTVLLADRDGQILGVLECKGRRARAMRHVTGLSMSVRREFRDQGVGYALLSEAVAWAQSNRIVKRVELFVFAHNGPAIHLYEKFGFEVEGRCRRAIYLHDEYLDDLIMAVLL